MTRKHWALGTSDLSVQSWQDSYEDRDVDVLKNTKLGWAASVLTTTL